MLCQIHHVFDKTLTLLLVPVCLCINLNIVDMYVVKCCKVLNKRKRNKNTSFEPCYLLITRTVARKLYMYMYTSLLFYWYQIYV